MANIETRSGRDAFERFLGAAVGEDVRGTSVTVLSMLARLRVDPWREAFDLDAMPESPARQRLEALLARFKDVPTAVSDRGRVALGLLAFLPHQARPARHSPKEAAAQAGLPPFGAQIYWISVALLFFGWIAMLIQGN